MPNLNDIMEMMDALETKAIITIPTFCVAVRNRHSSCHKCADVCLADAFTIEKNELNIDAGACVACGACVAVCPTSALVPMDPMPDDLAGAVAETTNAADGLTVIACARKAARNVGDPDKYAVVPCLARMEEELLVELVAAVFRRSAWWTATAAPASTGARCPPSTIPWNRPAPSSRPWGRTRRSRAPRSSRLRCRWRTCERPSAPPGASSSLPRATTPKTWRSRRPRRS